LLDVLELNMQPTPCSAAPRKRVRGKARAHAPARLAAPRRATAIHSRAHPPAAFVIAPSSNKKQPQTYVLAALYALEDTNI